jgi:hypothetical protein
MAMPPVILWALGAVGGFAVVRWLAREGRRINEELERARTAHVAEGAAGERIPTLRRDPVTGTYRPD